MSDHADRLAYLDEVLRRLFPPPASPGAVPPPQGPYAPYSLLPHRLLPRRLVPRAWWHGPLGRPVPVTTGPETIAAHLADVLGMPVRVAVRVRPARRANRKPVLEVRRAGGPGRPIAFVKIGDTAATAALVRHESATLRMLAAVPLRVVSPPPVLHHGTWHGMEVLVLGALPVRRALPPGHRAGPALLRAAIREIGALGGPGGWAWHGDLTPWNLAPGPGGRLLVWDWERFGTGVPPGFDALHHDFHRALRLLRPPDAARRCVARSPRLLAPYGVPPGVARDTALRYLAALAARRTEDRPRPDHAIGG